MSHTIRSHPARHALSCIVPDPDVATAVATYSCDRNMLTLTAIVAYMLACIVALAFGVRWMIKNDPLLKQQPFLDTSPGPRDDSPR